MQRESDTSSDSLLANGSGWHQQEEAKSAGAAMSVPLDLSCLHGTRGPDSEAALTMLEKQLICPICLELFNKPVVILPCQHNLCRKCANELYQPSLFQARTTMLVNSGRFRCPSCRHEVVLDRHGVYGLQRNLLVENIIDAYKEEVSKHTATSLVPAPSPPAELTCSDHEGEKVNIYCLTCQVPICSLCKVFGAHQFCQVAPLTDIYQQKKDELSEGVSSLKADNYKIQAFISDLEESCCNIEDNCKTQKQIVCDTFSRLFSILEEKHKAMTQHISSEEEEKTSHAQAVVHCYRESVEANSKLMETAATFMEGLDMAAFVQNSRGLITKVVSATSSCPTEMLKPGFENVSHYRCNFRRQESALRSIDFIKAASSHILQEPEVEPEPEEHSKPFILNTEPNYFQETSDQCLQTLEEPVKDLIPLPISAPVEAEQPAAPTPLLVPHLLSDSPEPCDLDEPHERSVVKNKDDEAERSVAPRVVKEGKICEGMSTQQAVTLLVYLLAFLVILHRVWAYVGCFICM